MAHSTRGYQADADRRWQAAEFLLKRVIRAVPLYWLALLWNDKRSIVAGPAVAAALLLAIENSDPVRGLADGPFAALIVWAAVQWPWKSDRSWLRAVGDASYSIYLFHLATFGVTGRLLHAVGLEAATPLGILVVIASHLAIATAAGLAIHRWLEQPVLDFLRGRLARSRFAEARVRS